MFNLLYFAEIYKERIWGGRNLERLFGKKIPKDKNVGESWELADLPEDKSVVSVGPTMGKNISQLVKEWGGGLLGHAALDGGQFPLLIKLLDANDILSVQVHPDYTSADAMGPSVRAKYECWYIMEAEEDAYVYIGFKPGVTPEIVEDAITQGTLATLLVKHRARKGDFFYLPGGTVHALGSGLVVAEIQTPSDTTFRLYDWNRVDAVTGKARKLHIEESMKCLHFSGPPETPKSMVPPADKQMEMLVEAPTFTVAKAVRNSGDIIDIKSGDPIAWIVIEGSGEISDGEVKIQLRPGQTLLIPAGCPSPRASFQSKTLYLEARLTR
jgi:mannose-6-phosphate isomerase